VTGEALALKYRPRVFEEVVGQRSVSVILRAMVLKDQVPAALLFDGVRGTGKTTSARILAAALNCQTDRPCGSCASCRSIYDGSSLAVWEIDAASNGLVGDMRQLVDQARYQTGGNRRVILLDEAHSMSREANNVLLKTLEEPPPATTFVLLTTEPTRILGTVLSRCMSFQFRRISVLDIQERLAYICAQESIEVEPALLTLLAVRADGGMRDAIMTLDQMARAGALTVAAFQDLMGESDFAPSLVDRLSVRDMAGAFGILEEQLSRTGDVSAISSAIVGLFRDLLILKGGGSIPSQGESLEARTRLASRLDPVRLFAAMRTLWDLRTKIRVGEDSRSSLELSVVMLADQLSAPPTVAVSVQAPAGKLSLGQLGGIR
jgi:DNA polymerase III subunit gamma/tau